MPRTLIEHHLMMDSMRHTSSVVELLSVLSGWIGQMGHAHHFICGSRSVSSLEPSSFFCSNLPPEFFGGSDFALDHRATDPGQWRDPFLPFVPPDRFLPFRWETGDASFPKAKSLERALVRANITGGVCFVQRGFSEDVICLTLLNKGAKQTGQTFRTLFGLRGPGVFSDDSPRKQGVDGRGPAPFRWVLGSLVGTHSPGPMDSLAAVDPGERALLEIKVRLSAIGLTTGAMDHMNRLIKSNLRKDGDPHHWMAGTCGLTSHQISVGRHMVEGLMSKVIAERLHCSTANVNYHIGRIYRKLHVRTRAAAVVKLQRMGIGDRRTGT